MRSSTLIFLLVASDLFTHKSHRSFITTAITTTSPTEYCEYVPDQCQLSNDTNCINPWYPGSAYFGTKSDTINGYTCQVWSSSTPHVHNYPYTGGACRDPDQAEAPWCYTTDPDVRWDLCFQPQDSCGRKRSVRLSILTDRIFHIRMYIYVLYIQGQHLMRTCQNVKNHHLSNQKFPAQLFKTNFYRPEYQKFIAN